MIHDVVKAEYIDAHRIRVTFHDGKDGIVDFSSYLGVGGVFDRFRDMEFFTSFSVDPELGVLTWGGEIDIAPETLYSKATGEPLPDWMVAEELKDETGGYRSGTAGTLQRRSRRLPKEELQTWIKTLL